MTLRIGEKVYLVKNPNQLCVVISNHNSSNDRGFDNFYTVTPEDNYILPNGVIDVNQNIIISEREVFRLELLKSELKIN